ncbi:unnamed protein product [Albugo candida]|uniref:Uncharacterized protein n=1 Tax=Albugo candida TaxID=65357 RepID=A0A024FT37_9STRA|nr:unnamed protein product [Albugo candida]|eukprot:CCI10151.1 unnamed protein product [Albugo candida]
MQTHEEYTDRGRPFLIISVELQLGAGIKSFIYGPMRERGNSVKRLVRKELGSVDTNVSKRVRRLCTRLTMLTTRSRDSMSMTFCVNVLFRFID